jgi:hypothetical protein
MASKKTYPNTPAPKVGQVWEDNDPRQAGNPRRVRIKHIIKPLDPKGAPYAECAVICGRGNANTKIRLDRFKPTATGWKYIEG